MCLVGRFVGVVGRAPFRRKSYSQLGTSQRAQTTTELVGAQGIATGHRFADGSFCAAMTFGVVELIAAVAAAGAFGIV